MVVVVVVVTLGFDVLIQYFFLILLTGSERLKQASDVTFNHVYVSER